MERQQTAKPTSAPPQKNAQPAVKPALHQSTPFPSLLQLQRSLGNQAVQRLFRSGAIQAKLTIGAPGDRYEQEADRVADQVMRMPEPVTARPGEDDEKKLHRKPLVEQISPLVQSQVADEKDEKLQRQSWFAAPLPLIQRAVPVAVREDDEEKKVQTKPITVQRLCPECEKEKDKEDGTVQRAISSTPTFVIQRLCPECEQKLQRQAVEDDEEKTAQAKSANGQANAASSHIEASINAMKGGGSPLPESSRNFYESRFGADFGSVRVHTDSLAAETSRAINARAFTVGSDIGFGAGQYVPETSSGKSLLAHELAHVVQQVVGRKLDLFDTKPKELIQKADINESTLNVGSRRKGELGKDTKERAQIMKNAIDAYRSLQIKKSGELISFGYGDTENSLKEEALNQIRDLSTSLPMLREIRVEYRKITGGRVDNGKLIGGKVLEKDLQTFGVSSGHYKEALSILYQALSLGSRLQIFDNITENESAMLDVLRNSSQEELKDVAKDKAIMDLLKQSLNDDEYYEAIKLITSKQKFKTEEEFDEATFNLVVDRIKEAQDIDAVYDAILDIKPKYRRKLWEQRKDIFPSLSGYQAVSIEKMCTGTEEQALKIRLYVATADEGTDDDAVKLVVQKTASAAQIEKEIAQKLASGKNEKGEPLSIEDEIKLRNQLKELGGIEENLLRSQDPKFGEFKRSSFLEMLYGDVSSTEYYAFTQQMGVDKIAIAKQQILDAIGTFKDDEEAVYKAINSITAPLGKEADRLSPEEKAILQQRENSRLRWGLMQDKQIKDALEGNLSQKEMDTVYTYLEADPYQIALKQLEEAFTGIDIDEERIFKILTGMSEVNRIRLKKEQPPIFWKILNPNWMTAGEIQLIWTAITTGKIPTEKGLEWAFGGNWDGTEDEMIEQVFAAMDDDERYQYRLGYYLYKEGERKQLKSDAKDLHSEALAKFTKLYDRMKSELGTDDLQKALDQLLRVDPVKEGLLFGVEPAKEEQKVGVEPTKEERRPEDEWLMSVKIMKHRVMEKGNIREEDKTSSAFMDTFFEEGEVSDLAEIQFLSAYNLAIADDKITFQEFLLLRNLYKNFAQKYEEYVATVDQFSSVASNVAAIAAAVVITALSGGTAGPAIAGLLTQYGLAGTAVIAGAASAAVKIGVKETIGASHYDATSTEGLRDLAIGFTEGAMTVLSAGLADKFIKFAGLTGGELTGEMAAGIVNVSNAAISGAGKTFAVSGLKHGIEGFIAGLAGELVLVATDEEVWKKAVWEVLADFAGALLKAAGTGFVTGFLTGGALEALSTYVGVKRVQKLLQQLDEVGISEERLSKMSIDSVKAIGKADAALAAGNLDEAEQAFRALRGQLEPDEFARIQRMLHAHHGARAPRVLTNLTVEEFTTNGEAQRELFELATRMRDQQQQFADNLLADLGIQGGEANSILKRDNFEEFVQGVVAKCRRNKYTYIDEMDDIVRGRFNLETWEDVQKVADALENQRRFLVKEKLGPRRPQQAGGYGYPRYHIVLEDQTTGLAHEWQVGTRAATQIFETPGIRIPTNLTLPKGMKPNLHDIEYDIFRVGINKKFPDLSGELGIPEFLNRVDQLAAEAGSGGALKTPLKEKLAQLHEEASSILQNLVDRKSPEFVQQFYH